MKDNKKMIAIIGAVLIILIGLSVFFIIKDTGTSGSDPSAGVSSEDSEHDSKQDESRLSEDAEKESGSDRSESGSETGNVSGGVEARGETTGGDTSGSKKSKDAGKSGKTQESGTSGQSQAPTTPAQQETTGSKEASNLPAMTFTGTAKEYEAYCSLSVEDQYEIFKKYFGYTKAEVARYNNWYQTAKKAYQQEHPAVTLEPGVVIDLGN